ncbi:response regulator [Petrachloros mirabilis]
MSSIETEQHIRVVIVDDHRLFREGIRLILSREEGIVLVGEAAPGLATIELLNQLQPDVVLLDTTMPGIDGIEFIGALRQNSPAIKLLILTAERDEALIFKALRAGAKGYLSKNANGSYLSRAIQAVHHGELWVERSLVARFVEAESIGAEDRPERRLGGLTAREEEILRLLVSGGTNKEIAHALSISEKTVKAHLNSIFRKLHVTCRLQAGLIAVHRGLGLPARAALGQSRQDEVEAHLGNRFGFNQRSSLSRRTKRSNR